MSDALRLAEELRNQCLHLKCWVTDETTKRLAEGACEKAEKLLAEVRVLAPMPPTKPGRFTGD